MTNATSILASAPHVFLSLLSALPPVILVILAIVVVFFIIKSLIKFAIIAAVVGLIVFVAWRAGWLHF